jgi:hypothetical protein
MDEENKVALIYRLGLTLEYLQSEDFEGVDKQLRSLIYEVEKGLIIPF